jgi:hypothetical protein
MPALQDLYLPELFPTHSLVSKILEAGASRA